MKTDPTPWLRALLVVAALAFAAPALASSPNLVSAAWLRHALASGDVLLLDASTTRAYGTKHIPGAVNADLFTMGPPTATTPAIVEARLQGWGVTSRRRIVVYDRGGDIMAPWLFYELYYHGFPGERLHLLDGGLAAWEAAGGPVTKDASPAPARGDFRVGRLREDVRVRGAEFVAATGDPGRHVVVEALEPAYHYGESKFFDRAGHIPHAVMAPVGDWFNADKTFKSPEETRRMAAFLGIDPARQVNTQCGGGVAATVPFFALRFVAGFPVVKVYKESQLGWLQDDRNLPLWTYDAPGLVRDAAWLAGFNSRMMRFYGVSRVSVIDVRAPDAYARNHLPFAVNVPADVFRKHLGDPRAMAPILAAAGVAPDHEAVIVGTGGITPDVAIAFVMLEKVGQRKASVLLESPEDWGLLGHPLTKDVPVIGTPRNPADVAIPAAAYPPREVDGVLLAQVPGKGSLYPAVQVRADALGPAQALHLPASRLLDGERKPRPAHEIWKAIVDAKIPRYAEVLLRASDPGDAAVGYLVLRLMGLPDVKVVLADAG